MSEQRGSILIFTLWVLIILAAFSMIVASRASSDIRMAKYESENMRALYLAKSGFMKSLAELGFDKNNYDSLNEEWNKEKEFKFGGGVVFYHASDEEARFNLNSANLTKEQLIGLGVDEAVSRKILDYKAAKWDKGFEFMEELFLIERMTYEMYSAMEPYITIYRRSDPMVNINTAGEKVLNIALRNNSLITGNILDYRRGMDGKDGTEDDGIFTDENFSTVFKDFGITPDDIVNYQNLFNVKSNFFRIYARASFAEGENMIRYIAGVADRNGKVYYWKED